MLLIKWHRQLSCNFSTHAKAIDFIRNYISEGLTYLSESLPFTESGINVPEAVSAACRIYDIHGVLIVSGARSPAELVLPLGTYIAVSPPLRTLKFTH